MPSQGVWEADPPRLNSLIEETHETASRPRIILADLAGHLAIYDISGNPKMASSILYIIDVNFIRCSLSGLCLVPPTGSR